MIPQYKYIILQVQHEPITARTRSDAFMACSEPSLLMRWSLSICYFSSTPHVSNCLRSLQHEGSPLTKAWLREARIKKLVLTYLNKLVIKVAWWPRPTKSCVMTQANALGTSLWPRELLIITDISYSKLCCIIMIFLWIFMNFSLLVKMQYF